MRQAMQAHRQRRARRRQIDKAAAVLSRDPVHNAVLRDAASLTMVNGGIRANVIPSEATRHTQRAHPARRATSRAIVAEIKRDRRASSR